MSVILALAVVLILATGIAALRVINAVLPEKSRKVRNMQIYVVQYTAVVCCFIRAALDIIQKCFLKEFNTFQRHRLYWLYVFAFIVGLELVPLGVLVCVIRIQTQAKSAVGSELQSTLVEDQILAEALPGR